MELQTYIQTNPDYLSQFKEHGMYVQKKKHLALVKAKRNKDYDYDTNPWMQYCRGSIIDTRTNRVICVAPRKAYQIPDVDELQSMESEEISVLVDGTMVNAFFVDEEWMLSTRSMIGANNQWDGKQSFRKLFEEVCPTWSQNLDPQYCYSFVLVHRNNRNVSPINENGIFLAEQHRLGETIEKVPLSEIDGIHNVKLLDNEFLTNYKTPLYFSIKGFTVKQKNKRYKWINPSFLYVQGLKMNHNDKLMNYISLRQTGYLKEYLQYFPEESVIMNQYRDDFNTLKDELHTHYLRVNVYKTNTIKDVPYELKPLVKELHQMYYSTGEPITRKVVSNYLHSMDGKRVLFIYRYRF